MRYAYFDPNTRSVLGWIDTEAQSGDLPDVSLLRQLDDEEWDAQVTPSWVSQDLKLVVEPPPGPFYTLPSAEWVLDKASQKAAAEATERVWLDNELTRTNNMVATYRDELEADEATTLTAAQYKELQAYRSSCRKWPDATNFPDSSKRPAEPDWLETALAIT